MIPMRPSTLTIRQPVLQMLDYAGADWDSIHRTSSREWLTSYDGALGEALNLRLAGLVRHAPLLELGCGTSELAVKLYDNGWTNVTAVDVSSHAVAQAQRAWCGPGIRPGLRFEKANAKALSFSDGSVAAVLDKGTLDAMCCGDGFDYEAQCVSSEVTRVLSPGGRWICVSLMAPEVLLPIWQRNRPEWAFVRSDRLPGGLHLYYGRTKRRFTSVWHWHPIEGGWLSRSCGAPLM